MAKPKTALYLRHQTPEGKLSPYRPVAWDSKQRLRPGWCLVAGVAEQHKDVTYHLRRKKNGKWAWESLGADHNTALAKRDALSCATALAIATKLPAVLPVKAAGGVAIDAAINEYLHLPTGKAAHKDWRRHTLQSYTQSLKLFRVSCTKTFLREIDVDDLRTFKIHLRAQRTSTGKKIEPRTTYNHFLNVISFLNSYGRRDIIPQSEWPVYEEKKVVAYDPDAMHRLLQFADNDEADVIEFFLGIGFRNGEGTHLEWVDIDLKNREVHTYSKQAKYGWKVKDCEERIIGISDNLVSRLAARHQRHPGNGLVFANTKGKPDKHLLRIIKRVALRAKLNCGLCIAGALIPAALVVVRTQNFRPSRTSLC